MTTTPAWLRAAIRDLAALDRDGRLPELVTDWLLTCRSRGLADDDRLLQPSADVAAREVARAAHTILGVPLAEAEALAHDELRQHPRREVALELLAEYTGRAAVDGPAVAGKLARERRRRGA